jgi:TnpA family transposase
VGHRRREGGVPYALPRMICQAVRRYSTQGQPPFTEQLFGLCFLLGYSFMPRLRDLADQQLYKVDRTLPLGGLQPLFHSAVDLDRIPEQ